MKFTVITLFPEFIRELENYSIIGRAIKNKKVRLETINLRDFGVGNYKQVDDKPYGGGPGMLMRVDVAHSAIKAATKRQSKNRKIIMLSADGKQFDQKMAQELSKLNELVILCGHYEGFDKRIENYVDEKVSIGPYILSGGEIPTMTMIDTISRLLPGVLQNPKSLEEESFSGGWKLEAGSSNAEYPQYTRPEKYLGKKVPEVLLSGDHKKIENWRKNRLK